MTETEISVDVYGRWSTCPPAYRIYVDNELITERSFLAQESEIYREKILVNLKTGVHTFNFEILPDNAHDTALAIKNFKVNGTRGTLPNFTIE